MLATVGVTEVTNLCSALACDEFCEVSMTQAGVSEPQCICTVGYTKVAVTGSRKCNSKLLVFYCLAEIDLGPLFRRV